MLEAPKNPQMPLVRLQDVLNIVWLGNRARHGKALEESQDEWRRLLAG